MFKFKSSTTATALVATTILLSSCGPKPQPEPAFEDLTIEYLSSLSEEQLNARDSDGDGVSDYDELYTYGTNPLTPDSDGDGLTDVEELNTHGTDPLNPDSDDDGLSDGDEVNAYNTDPLNPDSDGDGLMDGSEVMDHNTDPNSRDTDGDGLSDGDEVNRHSTDPTAPDTDGDSFSDSDEIRMGTDPNDASDPGLIRELASVYFGFDRSNINADAAEGLASNVEQLLAVPGYRVRVDAYTDHVGGDQYNLRLSLRRANSVVEFYMNNGVSEDRIESRGLGKAPVPCVESEKDTDTPGCLRNRRAESIPLSPYGM